MLRNILRVVYKGSEQPSDVVKGGGEGRRVDATPVIEDKASAPEVSVLVRSSLKPLLGENTWFLKLFQQ